MEPFRINWHIGRHVLSFLPILCVYRLLLPKKSQFIDNFRWLQYVVHFPDTSLYLGCNIYYLATTDNWSYANCTNALARTENYIMQKDLSCIVTFKWFVEKMICRKNDLVFSFDKKYDFHKNLPTRNSSIHVKLLSGYWYCLETRQHTVFIVLQQKHPVAA